MGFVLNRLKIMLVVLVLTVVAATAGYMAGRGAQTYQGIDRSIGVDLLDHRGTDSGKNCEPRGKYGHAKKPPPSCDNL